ncbi:protein SMG7L isoform X2 [Prunus avium]|uniref:Protein SMG7L isoform X2 n=1 Tax=Prunus avium TaxID=42229 RepID=A0A6P5TF49_PRUAV|nr:protein SMG7L isoform X2 [Prunus avium]
MTANSSFPLKDQREKQKFLIEVANTENQLWSLIHSKGLLHSEVKDLYRKVRSTYENLILSDRDQLELQDIEYSLWKLHYKRIDEFRKRIKGSFVNAESKKLAVPQNDNHVEGFKLFLSEAIEFYQNLIVKIRKRNRLPEESVFLTFAEQKKMQKCQFLCHRFLVCVGDLARYKEQYEKPDAQNRNWSVAATNYLEATVIWPDSGNPHNQLAVLAIYIGDEFLALYHCIRSLAVKEPFPDAQGNLILLFERVISFIFSFNEDEFPCAFASTMGELEALMALDDTKLKVTLESYQHMDSVRKGPFRALQVVSVLIFTIQNLIKTAEIKESRDKNDVQQKELTQWALTATFIFMGRFVERSLKDGATETCPLLPAVLVFVEWLVIMLDGAEMHGVDEKSRSAMSYFFGAFVDLLKRFNVNEDEAKYAEVTPLWEDYELRGFAPVACAHASLDFSSHWVYIDKFDTAIDCRAQRIINAAIKIADKSIGSQKWIVYDKSGREFSKVYRAESKEYPELERLESNNSDVNQKVPSQPIHEAPEESEKQMIAGDNSSSNGKSVTIEDEEVILFRPLTRHNSAPLKISSALNDPTPTKGMGDHSVPSDECLRRATSLLIAQNQAQIDPLSFHADITNFTRSQQEPRVQDRVAQPFLETPIAAGPPSLSAWVLDGGNMSNNREKSTSGSGKHGSRLSPIEEIASESLDGLSISENGFASIQPSSSTYTAPVPSAPLLPDDADWFNGGIQSSFINCESSGGISMTDNVCDASHSPIGSYPKWTATQGPPNYSPSTPGFMDKYPPWHRMTSSEWLRQYRESLNLGHHAWPNSLHPPANPGNLYDYDTYRFHHINRWGNHAASNPAMHTNNPTLRPAFPPDYGDADGQRREKLVPGYQRTSPYGCGAVKDLKNEQRPLLQYLKEMERQLQLDPTGRGPTYMNN